MRTIILAPLALALAAAPLAAQAAHDPTHEVKGSGQLPPGWSLRFDPVVARPGRPTPPTPTATDVSFVQSGSEYRVTSGPAALYYRTADVAKGEFAISATFTQSRSLQHEAFGLFIGGTNLQDATQSYTYFVVRPMDGAILINHRDGEGRPTQLVAWTPDAAVHRESATDGSATNALTIHVARDSVHFVANGALVRALPRAALGGPTDGIAGMRINHNIDVRVSGYAITR